MPRPLRAPFYADGAHVLSTSVVENVLLARDIYRLQLDCPEVARAMIPGQFVMLRLADCVDPLLGRPMALYDTVLDSQGHPRGLDVVYQVVGKMTRKWARISPGEKMVIWGPLGNGFSAVPCDHLVMVAGGIGQTPFLALAKQQLGRQDYGLFERGSTATKRVTLCYGVRTAEMAAGVSDFEQNGVVVHLSSENGTVGHQGYVTDVLSDVLAQARSTWHVVCCGPEPMMEAVAKVCSQAGLACEVSLETPMACGTGICFSCVAKIRTSDGKWDYKRTCVEGPVFDANRLAW